MRNGFYVASVCQAFSNFNLLDSHGSLQLLLRKMIDFCIFFATTLVPPPFLQLFGPKMLTWVKLRGHILSSLLCSGLVFPLTLNNYEKSLPSGFGVDGSRRWGGPRWWRTLHFLRVFIVMIFFTGFTVLKIFGKRKDSFLKKFIFPFFSGKSLCFSSALPPPPPLVSALVNHISMNHHEITLRKHTASSK